MELTQIKGKPFARAKDIYISPSYIIGCTGQKAIITDRQLNLIHTIEGLDYVYSAQVSPDETKLLLISNGNRFYIVDMQTFEKIRVTVKAPYNHNLQGNGCWSFDGEAVWIPVQRSTDGINSTLRRYPIDDLGKYEEYLADKYCLDGISKIADTGTYFLTGYNRKEHNRYYFLYFDGAEFREVPLDAGPDMLIFAAAIDINRGIVNVSSITGYRQFTLDGKEITAVSHPAPKNRTLRTSDVFMHLVKDDAEAQKKLKEISESLGLEEISEPDFINKREESSCGNYIYLASQSGFYLLDANTGNILASVPERFGVQSFEELAPGVLAITTWRGVKLYQIPGH